MIVCQQSHASMLSRTAPTPQLRRPHTVVCVTFNYSRLVPASALARSVHTRVPDKGRLCRLPARGSGEGPVEATHGALMDLTTLQHREQQIWDRQQQLLELALTTLQQERKDWAAREAQLLVELMQLRKELQQLLLARATAATAALSAGSAVAAAASAGSAGPAAATWQSGSSSSGSSTNFPAGGSASAAVAAAIEATKNSAAGYDQGQLASWEGLFKTPVDAESSSSSKTVASILAAADTSDVLSADFDQTLTSLLQPATPRATASSAGSSKPFAGVDASDTEDDASSSRRGTAATASSSSSSSQANMEVEKVKAAKGGPPPLLQIGDDDIYWVAQLHNALMDSGYYPSEDDVENWFFGDSTQTALLTFQECSGLPQTGLADAPTWSKLLGKEMVLSSAAAATSSGGASSDASRAEAVAMAAAMAEAQTSNSQDGWPVVLEMDGGRHVHALQVALNRQGYWCGDDEMRWWQFGESTSNALKTFQSCSGLPESGVCDGATWQALLGPDAVPADIADLKSEEYEDDMTSPTEGAVWLLGEQRWSDPRRL